MTYIKILSIIKIDREDMKTKQEFDLHMHTSYSDGEHPLEIVLKKIKENELKIFSITDHDSVDSIREIKKYDLGAAKYIKGIEVS